MTEKLKAYLFSYDPATAGGLGQVHVSEYIKHNRNVEKWWTFLPNVYVITSVESRDALIDMFTDLFKSENASFILSPIDPVAFNGFLPKDAWTAFKSDIEIPYKKAWDI